MSYMSTSPGQWNTNPSLTDFVLQISKIIGNETKHPAKGVFLSSLCSLLSLSFLKWLQKILWSGFAMACQSQVALVVKSHPAHSGDARDVNLIPGLGRDPWREGMATHSSILAWRILQTEKPGGLQSMGLQRVEHYWSDLACKHAWSELEDIIKTFSLTFSEGELDGLFPDSVAS